ncbi:MAG: Uncharacterised protein [Flavobacteriaceae bacterium]|nr:MAG: Uncharacterised protein [Flavobacteriaceae bacterium]
MKLLKTFSILCLLILSSCNIVRVVSDYDKTTNFDNYSSFAFFKPGIDKAKISDLDKKRILRAIQDNLMAKGMNKNSSPDILVSIFTKESQRVDIYQNNFGGAWGWNPYWGGNFNNNRMISSNIEGSLFIDLIDAKTKELIWQGVSHSGIYRGNDIEKREEKIRLIVSKILAQYPPDQNNK